VREIQLPKMNGKQPYWLEIPVKSFVLPAAKRLGIAKQIEWHSFRRTFATLLKGSGADAKTTQELMRRANSRLTLGVVRTGSNAREACGALEGG
jgi:integrase